MRSGSTLWYKLAALVLVLALVVPVLAACGGDNKDETPTAQPAATATPIATPAAQPTAMPAPIAKPTPTPTVSNDPIKIGILSTWSGPGAISGTLVDAGVKVVDEQLAKKGGINVGGVIRPVKWIRYDDKMQVADNVAGYKKLVLEDKVSAVIIGGSTATCLTAASDSAEENKVPLFSVGSTPADLSGRPYTIRAYYPNMSDVTKMVMNFVVNDLKPKTVGLLIMDTKETRDRGSQMKEIANAAGIKVVYEQYVTQGTSDLSPFLTKIKYENPDVLLADSGGVETFYVSMFKQMTELGGWGDIKLVSSSIASSGSALKEKGAEGTYHWLMWNIGMDNPGNKQYVSDFKEVIGKDPTSTNTFPFYPLNVLIKSIEMAGSDDPTAIAKAARSGNLVWELAPSGPLKISPGGLSNNTGMMMQFKGGQLISVWK
ncbi:MAG: ABC transporter substrate-binding protein [Dehalococcoidia bacterium]